MTSDSPQGASATSPAGPAHQADADALLWPVACLLTLWDAVELELGETAVVTDGHRWSRLAGVVASWYGAHPVLFVSEGTSADEGATLIRVEDPSEAVRTLAARLQGSAGVAAAELSGRADFVDLLLESIPAETGLVLAGEARDPLTIDFYVNVHRKGLHMVSRLLDPNRGLEGSGTASGGEAAPGVSASHVERARRLLDEPSRLAHAHRALSTATTPPPGPEETRR